ncbi:MAG: hypothetical protein NZ772_11925 [Cyanobacteria bacterium]|nr:hypothetical protein [Cyanobacteriota bacterium]
MGNDLEQRTLPPFRVLDAGSSDSDDDPPGYTEAMHWVQRTQG